MKVGILQFSPRLASPTHNLQTADTILSHHDPSTTHLDLLVLPELAFTGYNFRSLSHIRPYLHRTDDSPSVRWAQTVAQQRKCHVIVGYPEVTTMATGNKDGGGEGAEERYFNSTALVAPTGEVVGNYRKAFLYYTDETWASEGRGTGFGQDRGSGWGEGGGGGGGNAGTPFWTGTFGSLGLVGHGICMDINPYRFEAPWTDYEFARAMLAKGVRLVVLSMAWLTRLTVSEIQAAQEKPDMETVAYWLERFRPFTDPSIKEPIVVVFANRCGWEGNGDSVVHTPEGQTIEKGDQVAYAGSSCVMHFQNGEVKLWGRHSAPRKNDTALMGKVEEGLLVVDTAQEASFMLLHER